MLSVALLAAVTYVSGTVYFKEEFGAGWEDRWIQSQAKDDYGAFALSSGKFYGDATINAGLQTSEDAHFYSISSKMDTPFSNKDKDLVLQFSVKHEQKIDCGGGYLKFMGEGLDQAAFDGDSAYNIMFGPDICGATKKIHTIFNYKGENHLIKKDMTAPTDVNSHTYTLLVKPDQTYTVYVDSEEKQTGTLEDDWGFLAPKMINDPEASKPEDWDDREMIEDPEDVKPEGYDDIVEFIVDPEAEKPEDWEDELDGDWEAPQIRNPEFKGPFTPKRIANPDYSGVWVHPQIDNPEYAHDASIYSYDSFAYVGIDLWQVKSGSIFDNIFIGDDLAEAEAFAAATVGATIEGEKAMKAEQDAAAAAEAEAAAAAAAEAGDDEFFEEDDTKTEL